MGKKPLKLFIWTCFEPDWHLGLAVALAQDEDEAKQMIVKERGQRVSTWGHLTIHPLTEKFAVSEAGGA